MIEEMVYDMKGNKRFERFAVRIALVREPTARSHPVFHKPEAVAAAFRPMADLDRECVAVALLDARHRLVGIHAVHVGTVTGSTVGPGDVFKAAILTNATGVIIVHNHPSGDPSPSAEDIDLFRRLREAGRLLGIEVHDHVVLGGDDFVSLRQRGMV